MSSSRSLGKHAETQAIAWLQRQGFEILGHNVRIGVDEIDILARKDSCIHCIEVKYRSSQHFGGGVAAVDTTKMGKLLRSATQVATLAPEGSSIVIDVISVDEAGSMCLYENVTL